MRRLALWFGTLLVTFLLGVGVFTLLKARTAPEAKLSIEDEWHRLYEAAAMTGDGAYRSQVNLALLCANRDGVPNGKLVSVGVQDYCKRADGAIRDLRSDGDYGFFHRKISDSHSTWSVNNLDFVRSVLYPKEARAYVVSHRSLINGNY